VTFRGPARERELTGKCHARLLRHVDPLRRFSMRIAPAILAITAVMAAAPARSQVYDPAYPVCLQTYGIGGGYIGCGYSSLAQCNATASGRAAQCIANPYYAGARAQAGSNYRRGRGGY
jgi:hypothetical protein